MITAMVAVGMYGNTPMGEDSSGGEEFHVPSGALRSVWTLKKGLMTLFSPRFAGAMVRLPRPEDLVETKPYKQLHRE